MNPYLVPGLRASGIVFERIIALIPRARLDEAIEPGRFTPREVMAHMADWEPIMRERIIQACRAPGSVITVFDEGEMAAANGYATSDPADRCAEFVRERRETVEALTGISPEDWSKEVNHPERGRLSAGDLANLILGHDMYHIEQLTAYLDGG